MNKPSAPHLTRSELLSSVPGVTASDILETNFKWWAQSKDFHPEDEQTIWTGITKVFASVEVAEPVGVKD